MIYVEPEVYIQLNAFRIQKYETLSTTIIVGLTAINDKYEKTEEHMTEETHTLPQRQQS